MLIRSQELCCSKSVCSRFYLACVCESEMEGVSRRLQPVAIAPRGNVNQLWYSGGRSVGADNTGPFVHLPWLSDILSLALSRSTSLAISPHFSLGHRMSRENNLQSVSHTNERQSHKHDTYTHTHKQTNKTQTRERSDVLFKKSDARVIVSQNQLPLTYPSVAVKAC